MNDISNKLNIDIYKAFEKHRIDGDKTIVVMWVRYVRYESISGRNPRLLINAFVTETGNPHNCSYDLCYNIKIVPPDFYFLIAFLRVGMLFS